MIGNIISGLILILLGVGFLMRETMGFNFNFYLKTYWPSILITIGLIKLFDKKSSKMGNLILIIIGGLLQANFLNIIDFSIWKLFWPILLILFGINLLISKKYRYDEEDNQDPIYSKKRYDSSNLSRENHLKETVILSGLSARSQSNDFKGGNATVILGGIDLDLRGADIKDGEAFLQLNVLMGGIDVLVPDHWKVEMSGMPILGGWDNKTNLNSDPNAPVLKIKCFVAFGGIDVK